MEPNSAIEPSSVIVFAILLIGVALVLLTGLLRLIFRINETAEYQRRMADRLDQIAIKIDRKTAADADPGANLRRGS